MIEPRFWHGLNRKLSPLGFGCWQIAGEHTVDGKPHGWGRIGQEEAVALIHLALERGIHFFDTAAGYGNGTSETILGQALNSAPQRNDAAICTKIQLTQAEEENLAPADDFGARVEASLARLQRDHIDVLLLHNPRDDVDWQAFDRGPLLSLQQQGKIITYGVSSRSLAGANKAVSAGFGTCLEWVFHLFERRPTEVVFPETARQKMNFIARSPLSRGLISPKYFGRPRVRFQSSEYRSMLSQDWIDWTLDCLRQLPKLGIEPEKIGTFALRYCLSFPEVSVVIPGLRRELHIEALMEAAASGPLEASQIRTLQQALPAYYPRWT